VTTTSNSSIAVVVPKDGNAPPLVHLDIVVEDIEPEIARLQALGARRLDEGMQSVGDMKWVRMADPEQNEFCVCTGVEW
jgi:hypothetical protein